MSKTYLSGIGGSGKAHYLVRRMSEIQYLKFKKILGLRVFAFVKNDELSSFYSDLCAFSNPVLLPDSKSEFIPPDQIINSDIFTLPSDDIQYRVFTIDKIKTLKNFIVCATDISINSPLPDPKSNISIVITQNQKYNFKNLELSIISFGYIKVNFVEDKLQFAIRGGIIDIWPAVSKMPVRILFEYDRVEALRIFDPRNQLSCSVIYKINILSVNSLKCNSTIKDYFESQNGKLRIENNNYILNNTILYFDYSIDKVMENLFDKYELIVNDSLNLQAQYQGYKNFLGLRSDKNLFIKILKDLAENNVIIKIYCINDGERKRIVDIFYENYWNYKNPEFLYGNLSQGFYLKDIKTAYISSRDILHNVYNKNPITFSRIKGVSRLGSIWEISSGDYVVHEKYGIGRYVGLRTISRENSISEYLCIEYKNDDKLYVPFGEIKSVKKYIGVEGVKPRLYSMDTLCWERIKSRAREAAAQFAKKLLKLYVQRSLIKRKPFNIVETTLERELANTFPYDETSDQLKAIEDIKNDFHKPYPMERLICGDVGYGKTEISVRVAFKVVQERMQVAVLVPTTILSQQHYNTFCNRLSIFPVKVSVLSRFQTKAKQKEIIRDLGNGLTDIVIGTHRLLQNDIKFKNLGLLIIDEEHRFGVKQKEKIKSIEKNIDILMLSATPIPRTLSSALTGFRDISVIETPPFGRLPIETNILLYNEKFIKDIIETELSRNGQVFYIYNKVETILAKASNIRKLLPNVKLGVIHGQMKAEDIEEVMWKFVNLKLDILLATTIIESGLDIPSVNTMIVEDAENFGISQLYQLRGRVGRDKEKAYCYLFCKDKTLSDEAIKRLEAMMEFSELGSGYRLALKDLEIRGAGSILSINQHGFLRDIGYDMFLRFIKEEGEKFKEDISKIQEKKTATINLQINALIPHIYIEDENIRILFYRKLFDAQDIQAIESVRTELIDRFGKIPDETEMLFKVIDLKLYAEKVNIERIAEDRDYIYIYFLQRTDFSDANIIKFIADYSRIIEFIAGKYYAFRLKKNMIDADIVEYLKQFLLRLRFYMFK